ncbi:sugar transferase [Planctomycetes bacterium K23_9]|uniref:UDP-glucose:undecaprenyl-phosphate glucose-1-phosphate transferase n=1 Tax=Stieleria marina TaxID=1930275 RepID=A0A517NYR2_9BACT|nr:UDP-glucose:undecaprenyl-phosphate glucose-1-phosphate transferase [Planctomycetes bacterium K23_9]
MIKRAMDFFVSACVLLIVAAPLSVIIVILKLTGEHEAFYFQDRVGLSGKIIKVTKLVTMVKNSASMGTQDITLRNDPRVLPVGKLLRKTKLNEIPQFWDVLVGKLSLVGWRPLMPEGFADYSEDIQRRIVTVKPGITGLGSLFFRDEESIITAAATDGRDLRNCYRNDIMPYKGALEMWYVDHGSLVVDIKIMIATAIAVAMPSWKGFHRWFAGLPVPKSDIVRRQLGFE